MERGSPRDGDGRIVKENFRNSSLQKWSGLLPANG
jgi:hypothetical protein